MVQEAQDSRLAPHQPAAEKPANAWAVGVPLGLVSSLATIILGTGAGPASFVIPALIGGGLFLVIRRKLALFGLTRESTIVVVSVLTGVTAFFALVGLQVSVQQKEAVVAAEKIVALGKSDPAGQEERLAKLDDTTLRALSKVAPALAAEERARRASEAQGKSQEEKRSEIAVIVQRINGMPSNDHESRRAAYLELAKLAPQNPEYARQADELTAKVERQRTVREHPEQGLYIVKTMPSKSGFGSIMVLNADIMNTSELTLKDFTIECVHSGPSGTQIDRNTRVVYEKVMPGQTKRLRDFNMGFIAAQVVSTSCTITNAKIDGVAE